MFTVWWTVRGGEMDEVSRWHVEHGVSFEVGVEEPVGRRRAFWRVYFSLLSGEGAVMHVKRLRDGAPPMLAAWAFQLFRRWVEERRWDLLLTYVDMANARALRLARAFGFRTLDFFGSDGARMWLGKYFPGPRIKVGCVTDLTEGYRKPEED